VDESILTSIKEQLGLANVDDFDKILIPHINTALNTLTQIGVGDCTTGYIIRDGTETWSDFFTDERIAMIQNYIFLKVKLSFDPPTGSVLTAYQEMIKELEWRINAVVDYSGVIFSA